MKPKTGKKIVSKGEYVKQCSMKYLLLGVAFAACTYGLWCAIRLVRHLMDRPAGFSLMFVIVAFCAVGLIAAGGLLALMTGIRIAGQIDPGIPATRANTADLSHTDSLVRASDEPVEQHQTTLLRAVSDVQKKHEEQLVRATGGTE